jgi:radical SAM superfamily enzyme YgiQ (UPF0313 family)
MPSVLLTILPPWGRPTVPIGLGYLSQTLAAQGVQHDVVDLNVEIFRRVETDDLAKLWMPPEASAWVDPSRFASTLSLLEPALEEGLAKLLASDARLVGFSVNQSNARLSVEAARRLRKRRPDLVIVFGGLGVFIHGERRTFPEGVVDLFVIGEGEETMAEIARRLASGGPLDGIPGTLLRPGAREVATPRPPLNLRHHIWPTYDRFPVRDYPGGGEPMPLTLGRGCVCRCSFCGDHPFWGKHRSRSGDDVVEEIEHHVSRYGVRRFEFNDLAVNSDQEALEAFCDGVIARGLSIEWSSYAYLREMPLTLPGKLRRAGCVMLRFGMESASDAVLRRMRKPHRRALAARLLATLSSEGVRCNIGLMVGFPDETDAELEETCTFLRENAARIHEVDSLSVFYVKPLSEVERQPDRFGVRLPEDHRVRWNRWEGRDGSTYDLRVARAWRLVEVIEEAGIRFQRCNIYGL